LGVDNVKLATTFVDTQPPGISNLRVRNPGFTDPTTGLSHTTDTTLVGQVTDVGGPNNVAYVAVDLTNSGNFTGPNSPPVRNFHALGNFQVTLPLPLPGPYTVGVEVVTVGGSVTSTTTSFFVQGPSLTDWAATGPGPTRWVSQGADYSTVSGIVQSTALDPR